MQHQFVHEWFSHTASQYPTSIAIEAPQQQITYSELEQRSNLVAQSLAAAGAKKGDIVAIFAKDRVVVIESILGILKCGCAFMPIVPDLPDHRIAALLEKVTPRHVIVEPQFAERFRETVVDGKHEPQQVRIEWDAEYTENGWHGQSEPDDLCYIFFTSGSTGQPKGIAGRLKSIGHFIRWEIKQFGFGPGVRVSQLTAPSFDAILRDIFVPLCVGGTICLPPEHDIMLDPARLVQWMDQAGINVLHTVPSVFRTLLDHVDGRLPQLTHVLLAGERLPSADVKRWFETVGQRVTLVNLYGPSETTMTKFFHPVTPDDLEKGFIPIGKPIDGTKAILLDEQGRPCAEGSIGEIIIRTPYRSHGYYGEPELTGRVFVPNPFSKNADDLVYKTGDLGRVLPNGAFEFIGRTDHQVKIRGVRVEPGEVENALRATGMVRDALVLDRQHEDGNAILLAYLILSEGADAADVRTQLLRFLPDYIIPSAFITLDSFPLTPHGKVDRKALLNLDHTLVLDGPAESLTPVEEILAGIWSEVLKQERISVYGNFFELGGHSLLATQVISRIKEAFGVDLHLRCLFDSPTVRGLAATLEQELKQTQTASAPPITSVSRTNALPLSFAQQRLWFIDQLDPMSATYNIPAIVRLKGQLNLSSLERTLTEIVRRHEALRTRFVLVDSEAVQVIEPAGQIRLAVTDLSGTPELEREAAALRLAVDEANQPFDLSQAPMLRAALVRLDEADHILLLTMHHIASDAWSLGVLVQEVVTLYKAFDADLPAPLPELSVQYADFAHWQRNWLQGDVLEQQLSYWRTQLSGAPTLLDLPTDRPRPAVQSFRGARYGFNLGVDLSEKLQELSRREGVTLFMTLMAAFQTLLWRYSAQEEIVTGTAIAGRNRRETEQLIGFFVNTLVLRTRFNQQQSFADLLGQVREVALKAYAHQDLPFEKLVEELEPERSLSHTPLFQVMFILQNAPLDELELPELQLSTVQVDNPIAHFDLTLIMQEEKGSISGTFEYATDLFDAATVERMAGHLRTLLDIIVADSQQSLSQVLLLNEAERHLLLTEYNETATNYPQHTSVAELFEQQVDRDPNAVALIFGHEQISYAELNRRANQLAHHLIDLQVGPDVVVGVLMDRSIEMIVALLGILKAGGAYLPLDPAYPAERLGLILKNAAAPVLLTREHLRDVVSDFHGHTISLDGEAEILRTRSVENPAPFFDSEQLCYVMYTSGSTGQPKGIGIPHHAVVRLVRDTNWLQFSPTDVFLQLAPLSFDAATFEIWGSLLNGSSLVIMPPEQPTLEELAAVLRTQKVTTLWLTAGLFHLMVDEQLESLREVRQVVAGGDVLSVRHVQKLLETSDGEGERFVINGYGPTENTTFTCCHRMQAGELVQGHSVAIGKPISNTQVYVLDERMEIVPVGVVGELYIGGAGLARGYHGEAELTAENFVPHPYSEQRGQRLYRSGDLVRYRAEGELEFVRRRDEQVKVRGYRIELGEVETTLASHSEVKEAAVIVRADGAGGKRLVAYIVAEEPQFAVEELRDYLKERLPEYMIPSAFVQLEAMPLTTNGKLDRRALPAPDFSSSTEVASVPASPVEELLLGLWRDVLGVSQIGLNDDFFQLGGHSLLATQLISRVRQSFKLELPLRVLFEAPTIAELAHEIERNLKSDNHLLAPPMLPVSRDQRLPLSFAQQRLWFIDELEAGSAFYNIPAAVRLIGELDIAALEKTLTEVVRRHESLRTGFDSVDGEPVQVINPPVAVRMEVTDLSALDEAEREATARRMAEEEGQQAFDLRDGLLLRGQILRMSESEHVVLFTMHHIASDGWSRGVLIKEIAALYEAYSQDLPSPLPELTIQYSDFAHWQRSWLQNDVLEQQLSYWRAQLSGAPALLELPTDRPRPAVQTFRGANHTFALSVELSEKLHELSRREGVTLFMTLLAGFQTLLWRYTGEADIVTGVDVANRNRQETEQLIGFFVNSLALRTKFNQQQSFIELLGQVRDVALKAYAHQDTPFEKLVEELQPERSLSHTPIFQVMFTVQNAPLGELKLPRLQLSWLEMESAMAKFDLTLSMEETNGHISGTFEYNTDLFDASTIQRMGDHLTRLLEGVAANPEQRTAEFDLLTDGEREQLQSEFNNTATEVALDRCFHRLFEEQVEKTPMAVAVEFEGKRLTYRQLNERANQLARNLVQQGVGPEILVAFIARRGIDFLTAVLAIFKAGGAYVPLDPMHPSRRLAQVLTQSRSSLVLSAGEFMEVISRALEESDSTARVVSLDDLLARECEAENLAPRSTPGNLAYVIYTSGSTGTPKGAMLEQRGMCNHLWSKVSTLQLNGDDIVAQTASQSFDVSVWQMLAVLLVGGKVWIAGEDLARDSVGQLKMVAEEGVTILEIVPSQLRAMVEEMETIAPSLRPNLSSLKWLIVNGEALIPELCRRWFSVYSSNRLINAYGPTECSDDVTQYVIDESPAAASTKISIGEPLANMRMYVLDTKLAPVPVGVTGELYVGGIGVGRGYLSEPSRTAEIYIPDCFGNRPGARLYKTGDRVRWLSDGNLDFIERIDHQVKVRGYRIELGEIEAALGEHTQVSDCVVMVRETTPGLKRLVAYVVVENGSAPVTSSELSSYLAERLPEYMVPSAFVYLEAMPLTSNGKTDRHALPMPDFSRSDMDQDFVGARTPVEELLLSVWRELLGVEQIGIEDDFFELGGHSLLATQLMSRMRNAFGVEVPLRQLFEGPTVAELAPYIEAALKTEAHLQAPPIVPVSREIALPLSFAQQRLWFLDQLEPNSASYNVPVVVRLSGHLNVEALHRTLNEVVRRHETLRTTFVLADGEPVQVIKEAEVLELSILDLSGEDEDAREVQAQRLAEEEARRPFDLSRGPLLRTKLLRLAETEHVVLFTMHHIASDGWSMGVLIKEVAALYEAFSQDLPSPLPELSIQYADFAHWQRNWLQGEVMETLLGYWRRRLGGTLPVLNLPTDHKRPPVPTFRGRTDSFMIPATLSESMQELSQQQGSTLFMTLLASFKILLMRYTQQEDLIVGTAIANRNHGETESLIGFFINMLPLRTDLSGDPSFSALLKQVREVALGAYAHQDIPFEKLVEAFVPERTITQTPLVQIAFGFNNAPRQLLELPGLTLSAMPFENETGRFDLTLWIDQPEDELRATWYYNTDLFEPTTIERMHGHFETLLREIAAQPDARLSALEMLTETEKQAQAEEQKQRTEANIKKLRSITRKALTADDADKIRIFDQRLSASGD
ncbi:MAG TPA: amino acid adenylation domain-containing protein [Pyrinomonadaceae bacterium]|nr:amino acid adenylation domain-containing protein [Pyrinomonadaceae bacterium]